MFPVELGLGSSVVLVPLIWPLLSALPIDIGRNDALEVPSQKSAPIVRSRLCWRRTSLQAQHETKCLTRSAGRTHVNPTPPCGPYTVQLSMISPTTPLSPVAVKMSWWGEAVSRLVAKYSVTP